MIRASARLLTLLACGLLPMACQTAATPAPLPQTEVNSRVLPSVTSVLETQNVYDVADDTKTKEPLPPGARRGSADDPAIWVHPTDPAQSLVIGSLKDGGLDVYDLDGQVLQSINPTGARYNNVDLIYRFPLPGAVSNAHGTSQVDLVVATDRYQDKLAIYAVDPATRQLTEVGDPANPLIFTPAGASSDKLMTAYGLATYASPTGQFYAFVTRRESGDLAQLELASNEAGQVSYRPVRRLTVPLPASGEMVEAQLEGMVVDQHLGVLYAAQEQVGIWKFSAAPDGGSQGQLLHTVRPTGRYLEADVEGLTIYYGVGEQGYLLASSQGDSTFVIFARDGQNEYLGNFQIGGQATGDNATGLDGIQACDGAHVVNVALGDRFPQGLFVVQDGYNRPEFTITDNGVEENANTNFKFVAWEAIANAFDPPLLIHATNSPATVGGGTARIGQWDSKTVSQ